MGGHIGHSFDNFSVMGLSNGSNICFQVYLGPAVK
jgi:hypothetical protein